MPAGLDQAVLKMKQGERALVTVAPAYGYKDQGASAAPLTGAAGEEGGDPTAPRLNLVADVPPNAPLTLDVSCWGLSRCGQGRGRRRGSTWWRTCLPTRPSPST